MYDYPEAYTDDNLYDILTANDAVPDEFGRDNLDRLLDIARARADARGEQNALDAEQSECLIGTDWTGFAGNEFGYDGGKLNNWAFGILEAEVSRTKNATLFTDTHVVQQSWLETGDGRKSQTKAYVDDEYDGANEGDLWIPEGAQEYIAIVILDPELLHGSPTAADAM
jgi:hypothetical protein